MLNKLPMLNGNFKFHPVGQGLFYSGSITDMENELNFIYDCGSVSKKCFLDNSINRLVDKLPSKIIDFLIVSHLDADHINGIKKLIDEGIKIKRIYLPYYVNKDFVKLHIDYILYMNKEDFGDELRNFWYGLYGIGDVRKNIDTIIEFCGYPNDEWTINNNETRSDYIVTEKQISTNYKHHFKWKFIMFNKRLEDEKLCDLLKKLNEVINNRSFEKLNKNALKNVKKIYKKYSGMNASSTVLIHYPVIDNSDSFFACLNYPCCCQYPFLSGRVTTVLTGDAEFNKEMRKRLSDILEDAPLKKYCKFRIMEHVETGMTLKKLRIVSIYMQFHMDWGINTVIRQTT